MIDQYSYGERIGVFSGQKQLIDRDYVSPKCQCFVQAWGMLTRGQRLRSGGLWIKLLAAGRLGAPSHTSVHTPDSLVTDVDPGWF